MFECNAFLVSRIVILYLSQCLCSTFTIQSIVKQSTIQENVFRVFTFESHIRIYWILNIIFMVALCKQYRVNAILSRNALKFEYR